MRELYFEYRSPRLHSASSGKSGSQAGAIFISAAQRSACRSSLPSFGMRIRSSSYRRVKDQTGNFRCSSESLRVVERFGPHLAPAVTLRRFLLGSLDDYHALAGNFTAASSTHKLAKPRTIADRYIASSRFGVIWMLSHSAYLSCNSPSQSSGISGSQSGARRISALHSSRLCSALASFGISSNNSS